MSIKIRTMRFYIIIMIALMAVQPPAIAQIKKMKNTGIQKKENDFGRTLFSAFVNGDKNAWIALYPTNDEYKAILQAGLAAKAEGLTQQKIDEILVRRNKEAAAAYSTLFDGYSRMADSLGIQRGKSVFEKFDFNFVYPEPVKLKYLEATIWFRCGKRHYAMDGIQAVAVKTGYRLQALTNIVQVDDGD